MILRYFEEYFSCSCPSNDSQWSPKQYWTPLTFLQTKRKQTFFRLPYFCVSHKKERNACLERHDCEQMMTEFFQHTLMAIHNYFM